MGLGLKLLRASVQMGRVQAHRECVSVFCPCCSLNFKKHLLDRLNAVKERCGKSCSIHKDVVTFRNIN